MAVNPVDLVHRQLECLKYIPGRKGGLPSGEGLELAIVLLPSMLLDFRAHNVRTADKARGCAGSKICAVGGRAARAACALLHLLTDEDGTFTPYLLTKTGNLGRLLLENEFHSTPARRSSDRCFDFISPRDGEPRCAIIEERGMAAKSCPETEASELSEDDIRAAGAAELISRARTVYLSSVKTPHFEKLVHFLADHLTGAGQGLFIDASRSESTHLGDMMKVIAAHRTQLGTRLLAVFVRREMTNMLLELSGASAVDEFCKLHGIPLLECDEGRVAYTRPDGTGGAERTELQCEVPFAQENTPERFKAGVLLASSLCRTVRENFELELPLLKLLRDEWPGCDMECWRVVLEYGVALATVAQGGDSFCSFQSLLKSALPTGSDHLPADGPIPTLQLTGRRGSDKREIKFQKKALKQMAQLAGLRRSQKGLQCYDLPLCKRTRNCGLPQCQKAQPQRREPSAAILIDLDGTLMDSTEQRDRALAVALGIISQAQPTVDEPGRTPQDRVKFFADNVYDLWPLFRAMGLGDFRQQWNHQGWYVTYILFAANKSLCHTVTDWWKAVKDRVEEDKLPDLVSRTAWVSLFKREYAYVERTYRDAIRAAQAALTGVELYPLKEARDFLRSLQRTGAFHLYICSEGHPDTQWQKIRSAGLDDFFDRQHVLTTGDAAEPTQERTMLAAECAKIDAEEATCKGDSAKVRHQLAFLAEVEDAAMIISEDYQPLRDQLLIPRREQMWGRGRDYAAQTEAVQTRERAGQFAGIVLERMGLKGAAPFYAAAVRAILLNPWSPLNELKSFDHLIRGSRPDVTMKFAMVGDRQTLDVEAPMNLLGPRNVLTIRLVSGKYAEQEKLAAKHEHEPMCVAYTLAQAKAIILSKDAWSEIACVGDPPVFNWTVDVGNPEYFPAGAEGPPQRIGLDFVTCGAAMPAATYPIINRICAGILVEHLDRCRDKAERNAILEPYLGQKLAADPRHRIRVLSSLESAGFLDKPDFADQAESLAERLLDDATELKLGRDDPDVHVALETVQRVLQRLEKAAKTAAEKAALAALDARLSQI